MKFGLTEKEFSTLNTLLLTPMRSKGAEIWIFGSRARGDHKKFSDIDILYDSKSQELSYDVSCMKESLEDSDLPYKVDIVDLKYLADSYKTSVLKDRIRL